MEKFLSVLKWASYAAVFLLTFAFQSAYAGRITLFGAAPDFLPLLVVCTAFWEGPRPGAVMGLAAGLLCGSASNLSALYTPLYFAAGYAAGSVSSAHIRTNFLTVTFSALLVVTVCVFSRAAVAGLLQIPQDISALLAGYGGCALFTVLGALPLYPLCRAIHRIPDSARRRRSRLRYPL